MAALFLLVGFPLIVRRRAPLVPVVLLMTAIVVQSVSTADAAEGAPLLVAALACAYAIAACGTRRIAVAGLLVALAGYAVQVAFDPLARTAEQLWAAAVFGLLVVAAWLLGVAVQGRREASALQAQTDQAEEAQRAAIAAERVRTARELHDMIAHNVSVVVVQSVAAQGVLDDQPARARGHRWPTSNAAAGRPSPSYAACSTSCAIKTSHMSCANHSQASPSSAPSSTASARQVCRSPCRSTANRRRIPRR